MGSFHYTSVSSNGIQRKPDCVSSFIHRGQCSTYLCSPLNLSQFPTELLGGERVKSSGWLLNRRSRGPVHAGTVPRIERLRDVLLVNWIPYVKRFWGYKGVDRRLRVVCLVPTAMFEVDCSMTR